MIAAHARLRRATTVAAVLYAAYDAFENILAVLRHHQERHEGAFPAFVLSAAAAGNGRDCIAEAPSLPARGSRRCPSRGADLLASNSVVDVAAALAGLSHDLSLRLTNA